MLPFIIIIIRPGITGECTRYRQILKFHLIPTPTQLRQNWLNWGGKKRLFFFLISFKYSKWAMTSADNVWYLNQNVGWQTKLALRCNYFNECCTKHLENTLIQFNQMMLNHFYDNNKYYVCNTSLFLSSRFMNHVYKHLLQSAEMISAHYCKTELFGKCDHLLTFFLDTVYKCIQRIKNKHYI